MTILVNSADGVAHQFPDGTDTGVIDRVMKQYATDKTAAPKAPAAPEAPHDLGSALVAGGNSTMAQLEQAGGALANTVGLPQTGKNLLDRAKANEATAAATYQPSADIAGNLADTYQKGGVASVAKKVGYGLAGAALPTAAAIGSGLATGGGSVALQGGLLLGNAALNLGGALQEKERQGLDGSRVSGMDAVNAAAQTAIQALPFAKGGLGTVGMLDSGLRGAGQAGGNIASATLQGGDPGSARDVASNIAEAGLQGAIAKPIMEFPIHAAQKSAAAVSDFVTTRRAGPDLQAYAQESKAWNDATDAAAQRLQAANPNMPPDEVQSRAYQLAQKSGATPPTYDTMTPQAQNGMAELATLQMYKAARQAITEGMGRPDADIAPAAVFKNILERSTATMKEMGNLLQRNGMIDGDQAGDFRAAIEEARKHNVQAAQNGGEFGYFDTLRDKVSSLEIDPAMKNQALQMLRVMDIASQASLLKNSKGPLERNATAILGLGGAAAGMALTGGATLGLAGGLATPLLKAQGVSALRGLDQVMGHGLPDILQRQTSIEKFAEQNRLSAVADPVAMQQMNAELRGLAPQSSARQPGTPPGYEPPTLAPKIPDQSMPQARSPIGPDPIPAPRPEGLSANPADRYPTVEPLRAPAPAQAAPPKVPGMPIAPGAAEALNASLKARADRISQAAQEAFPTTRTGWSAAIADTAGADHGAVRSYIDQQIAAGKVDPGLANILKQGGTIPRPVMEALTGHIRDLVDAGQIPRAGASAGPEGPQGGTVRNPQAYARTLAQEAETAQSIRAQHPELADVVNRMTDPTANGKTQAGRAAILDEHLAGIGHEPTRAAQEAVLRPLAGYGQKGASEGPTAPQGQKTGPSGGGGPSRPGRGQQGTPGFGTDPTQRGSGRGGSPEQILADKRFKTSNPAPGEDPERSTAPLAGLPKAAMGPDPRARSVAEDYVKSTGRSYDPPKTYARVDPERATRIADAYTALKDDPQDPKVKSAYAAMAKETLGQYAAMLKSGFRISDMNDNVSNPYSKPHDAIQDMRDNNRMSVFSTEAGYGSKGISDADRAANPLLADSGYKSETGKPLLINDIFRAVHDYFGHGKEGVGFYADGEENAWRSHAAMYSDEARQAMTTETRGQNSWVNYGPYGEANRKATPENTVYADQKIGLMPRWVAEEGAGDPKVPAKSYDISSPGQGVSEGNKALVEPGLRVKVDTTGLDMNVAKNGNVKPWVGLTTNNKNAPQQLSGVDHVLQAHPDAALSVDGWSRMMAQALGSNEVPIPPYKLIDRLQHPEKAADLLRTQTQGQIDDANHGFENAANFRDLYTKGAVSPTDTGKLFLWSFLSRGVSPYVQESMFLDAFHGVDTFLQAAHAGNFQPDKAYPVTRRDGTVENMTFSQWASQVGGEASPGKSTTNNLNAFGSTFLAKMSQEHPESPGQSKLAYLHDALSDPDMTGKQFRREFMKIGDGVGIDNKVVSFTALVAGLTDVMVLDRVQMRNSWDDGQFAGRNLYDGRKDADGKPVAGSALSDISYGAVGLLQYEAMEAAIAKKLPEAYAAVGRADQFSIGRWHWDSWVAESGQEASHGTLNGILKSAMGSNDPLAGVRAKQGEYATYAYGATYGRDGAGKPGFEWTSPTGTKYSFSPTEWRSFLEDVKKPANGAIPKGFKVTARDPGTDPQPWFNRKGVNHEALDAIASKHGREGGAE